MTRRHYLQLVHRVYRLVAFFFAEKTWENAGPLVFTAHGRLVFALARALAGPLTAARRHRQRGWSVWHWWWLLKHVDICVHCEIKIKKRITYRSLYSLSGIITFRIIYYIIQSVIMCVIYFFILILILTETQS